MTLVWIIVGCVLGNVCMQSAMYWFVYRPNDKSFAALNKAAIVALCALLLIVGVWCVLSPETAFA